METQLIQQLAIATGLVSLSVVVHLAGLDILQFLTRWHLQRFKLTLHVDRVIVPLGIVLGLFVLHGLEIWIYALVYWLGAGLPSLEVALYYSTCAYSSLGEAGGTLPVTWRVVGALEAINGILLIGWTTAFLFHILNHLMFEELESYLAPRGAIARSSPRPSGSRKGVPVGTNSSDTEFMQ